MALTSSEVNRIRYELGYGIIDIANPYITTFSLFETVIQKYLESGATTSSSTAVTAASSPTPVTLVVASANGISAGDRLVVDVDSRQEAATIQSVSGTSVTLMLSLAHSGTYPVTVEGGESIVRNILTQLRNLTDSVGGAGGAFGKVVAQAGIKSVDEIEFFGDGRMGGTSLKDIRKYQSFLRDELAAALNVVNLRGSRGSTSFSVY